MILESIYQIIRKQAQKNPTGLAICAVGQSPLTYGRLLSQVEYFAEVLSSRGIGSTARIATLLPESPEMAVALISIATRAVCAPLNPACHDNELSFYLKNLNADVLLIKAEYHSPVVDLAHNLGMTILELVPQKEAEAGIFSLVGSESQANQQTYLFNKLKDPAFVLYTSGTTAQPKLVPLNHQNLCVSARNICNALELTEDDRCLAVMPFFHIHGLSTLLATLVSGGSLICSSGFSAAVFFELLAAFKPTWYSASPTIHQIVIENAINYPQIIENCELRFIRSASGPMPANVIQELKRIFRTPFIEAYGMTESAPQIASNRLPPFKQKTGSVGQAAGPDVAIVDETDKFLPPNEWGEIVIRGTNVMDGYENDTIANQSAFIDGWFRTGDQGYLDEDGYLYLTGRLKEIINRGGEKISPREIDEILLQHPAIAQAATFPIPHPVLGENVAAVIVLKPGFENSESKEIFNQYLIQAIREFAAKHLTYFKVPQEILIVDDIPKSIRGKIQRSSLYQQLNIPINHNFLISKNIEFKVKPESLLLSIEKKLLEIWSDVLGINNFNTNDNFFYLGGHSLTATQVIARIRQAFQIELPLENLFEKPTVAELASLIARYQEQKTEKFSLAPSANNFAPITIQKQRTLGTFPLSFVQQRLWFLSQLEDNSSAYNMSVPLWLSGSLDVAVLEQSLNEIRKRHEILRTSFQLVHEEPVQVISEAEEVPLSIIDLMMLPSSERQSEALRLTAEETDKPFNLADGHLLRTKLVRLENEKHLLIMTLHHIIADGWSTRILHQEIKYFYEKFLTGQSTLLLALPIQYSDYALWQRQWLQGDVLTKQLAYWKQQLENAPSLLPLPTDWPRPTIQTHRGARLPIVIASNTTTGLKTLAVQENATLFMVVLAAFGLLLSRYTGEQDIVVGTPIANRRYLETENLIGCFANTLVLRSDLSGNPTFRELLNRIQTITQEAYAHQDLPFDKLVEELHPERDLSRMPLFQVMLAFQNIPDTGVVSQSDSRSLDGAPFEMAHGLIAEPFKGDSTTSKFDLTLYLCETGQGLIGVWQYNTDLFKVNTIERLDRNFQTLLQGIVLDCDRHLLDLPLLDSAQRHQLELEWNQTQATYTRDHCFHELFEAQVARSPNAIALKYENKSLTYQELNEQSNQFARYLQHLQVRSETLVGILLNRSADVFIAILGVLKSGGAYLPLDPQYPTARLAFMLEDAQVSFLVTEEQQQAISEAVFEESKHKAITLIYLDKERPIIAQENRENVKNDTNLENLAYVIYTSGSTGQPKGVEIEHRNLSHYVQAMQKGIGINQDDCYLHTASLAFSSSVRQFAVPLACGATIQIAPTEQIRDPQALMSLIEQQKVTILDIVPSYWRSCIQFLESMPSTAFILQDSQLRLILSASEPLTSDLPQAWYMNIQPHVQLINMFGQTETTGIVTLYNIVDSEDTIDKFVPLGRPIANTQIYILDNDRQLVPIGVIGELYIGGAGVGRGYLNLPELTKERFIPNLFDKSLSAKLYKTGDKARYLPDGNIEFVGRTDNQIKVRGFRVEPEEIEVLIRKHPLVQECAIVAYTTEDIIDKNKLEVNKRSHQRTAAFVVFKDAVQPFKSSSRLDYQKLNQAKIKLRTFLVQKLPHYMVPSVILELNSIPLTPNGKIDRQNLSQRLSFDLHTLTLQEGQESVKSFSALPQTTVEKTLITIWQDVLKIEQVDLEDNFFDLGGDSILSVQIIIRANKLGLPLSLKQLFQYQTIAELAPVIATSAPLVDENLIAVPSPSEKVDNMNNALTDDSTDEAEPFIIVSVEKLRAYGREALEKAGLVPEGAAILTEVQLESSLRGQQTHNMRDIPRYARRLIAGILNSKPLIHIEKETHISALIDGDNGPGQWIATVAMEIAIKKAKESGVGIVGVRRSNHFGAAAQYVWMATKEDLIGLCTTNGPLILAPTNGVTPTFGNNPLGVGLPTGSNYPILLDIAMSVAPRGKIGLQLAEGKPLSSNWIFDHLGRPSSDLADLAAGLGIPIGGHKGYGLAFVFEGLAGVLTGAGFCWDHCKHGQQSTKELDLGHLFIAINPELFISLSEFKSRIDRMIEQTKTGERANKAKEILIPGELEMRCREKYLHDGIPLRDSTYKTLLRYAKKARLRTNLDK